MVVISYQYHKQKKTELNVTKIKKTYLVVFLDGWFNKKKIKNNDVQQQKQWQHFAQLLKLNISFYQITKNKLS